MAAASATLLDKPSPAACVRLTTLLATPLTRMLYRKMDWRLTGCQASGPTCPLLEHFEPTTTIWPRVHAPCAPHPPAATADASGRQTCIPRKQHRHSRISRAGPAAISVRRVWSSGGVHTRLDVSARVQPRAGVATQNALRIHLQIGRRLGAHQWRGLQAGSVDVCQASQCACN